MNIEPRQTPLAKGSTMKRRLSTTLISAAMIAAPMALVLSLIHI